MNFTELYEDHLEPLLEDILTEREQYNTTYQSSEVRVEGRRLFIRWYNHRMVDDPEGEDHFSERIIPFNVDEVLGEIGRQWKKLIKEQ